MGIQQGHLLFIVGSKVERIIGLQNMGLMLLGSYNFLLIPDAIPGAHKEVEGVVVKNQRGRFGIKSLSFENSPRQADRSIQIYCPVWG